MDMAESAKHSIILTDSSKFEQQGVVLQSRFENINMVYTDNGIPDSAKEIMERYQIAVEVIEV